MLKEKRNEKAIETFLYTFTKSISSRLDAIRLRFLSDEEIKRTVAEIKRLEKELKKLERELNRVSKSFSKLIDPTIARGTTNRNSGSIDLFDDTDFDDFDGIEIFTGKESDEEVDDEADKIEA